MSGSVLLHRQREDVQQLLAWYKIRDMLFGQNCCEQDFMKALKLASVCAHPNALWMTKLFAGRVIFTDEEAREVFLDCENDPRARCFAALLGNDVDEIRRVADLGDAFAQAEMAGESVSEECFQWAEKSAAQGERHGFYNLGLCYRYGSGCEKDLERAKEIFLAAAELGDATAMVCLGRLFDKDDPQRFVWFGRATANGEFTWFLKKMSNQVRNFNVGTGQANVVFVIGRALKRHINNDKRTIFGNGETLASTSVPHMKLFIFTNFSCNRIEKQLTVGLLLD